jgi:hypothetical protein
MISDEVTPAELRGQARELREKSQSYMAASKKLEEAADALERITGTLNAVKKTIDEAEAVVGRMGQIHQLLRQKGPLLRKDVLRLSGIPAGTIGAYLTKTNFRRDKLGRWSLKEEPNGQAK